MDKEDVIHTQEYNLTKKKKKDWNNAIFSNIEDSEIIILSECSQR